MYIEFFSRAVRSAISGLAHRLAWVLLAALGAGAGVVPAAGAECPLVVPGGAAALTDLTVRTKTVDTGACLDGYVPFDSADAAINRYRHQTVAYSYEVDKEVPGPSGTRLHYAFSQGWTQQTSCDGPASPIDAAGGGTLTSSVNGDWVETDAIHYTQKPTFEGTLSRTYDYCGIEIRTETSALTASGLAAGDYFPTAGFQQDTPVTSATTKVETWHFVPGTNESGTGTKTITTLLSAPDTFDAALARAPAPANRPEWETQPSLAGVEWGMPCRNGLCISDGIVCEVKGRLRGCPGKYDVKLWVQTRKYDNTDDYSLTPKEIVAHVDLTPEAAESGTPVTFTLPVENCTRYRATGTIDVKWVSPPEPAGDARCGNPQSPSSVHMDLSLGATAEGENAGYIGFHVENLAEDTFGAGILSYPWFHAGTVEMVKENGVVRQVYAPDCDVKIEDVAGGGFTVSFYAPVASGTKFVTLKSAWRFKPVTPGVYNKLEIKRTVGGSGETYVFSKIGGEWSLDRDGLGVEILDQATPMQETRTIKGPGAGDPVVFKERRTYEAGPNGRHLISLESYSDLNTVAETTTWHYYAGTDHLEYVEYPDGRWERYTYDSDGNYVLEISPWLDSVRTDTNLASHHYFETIRETTPITIEGGAVLRVTRIERIAGQEVGRTYQLSWINPVAVAVGTSTLSTRQVWSVQAKAPGLAWDAVGNRVTKHNFDLVTGHLWRSIAPDGADTTTTESLLVSGGTRTVVRTLGPDGYRITTTETNSAGYVVSEETADNALEQIVGLLAIGHDLPEDLQGVTADRIVSSRTALGFASGNAERDRPTGYLYLDGTSEEFSYACCGRLISYRDRDDVLSTYVYNSIGRQTDEIRLGIRTHSDYDAMGRVTKVTRYGTTTNAEFPSESPIVWAQTGYDMAGRVLSSKDAMGRETTYTYGLSAGGGRVLTKTLPDWGTLIETRHRDGQTFSIAGTAARQSKNYYGTTTAGLRWTQAIAVNIPGSETEWVKTYTDSLGRLNKREFPGETAGTVVAETYSYPSDTIAGAQPDNYSYTNLDGVTRTYSSDNWGRTQTAIGNRATTTLNQLYPLTTQAREIIPILRTTVTRSGSDLGGDIVTWTDALLDGSEAWDYRNNLVTHRLVEHGENGVRTEMVTAPDGATTIQTYTHGRLTRELRKNGASPAVTLSDISYVYDLYGRLAQQIQTGVGTTSYTYYNDGQVATVTTPDPDSSRSGPGYDAQVTSYQYDAAGRVSTVTQPDGTQTFTTYWPTGAIRRTWGSRTYPSDYAYDPQGRLTALTTWKDFAAQTGSAVTTWTYDTKRGWLVSKTYPGFAAGPTYTYWPSGLLKTRAWARGVTTTYTYNSYGELWTTEYSGGTVSTPTVTSTYDGLGRIKTRSDAAGALTRTYFNDHLDDESYVGGLLAGRAITRSFNWLNLPYTLTATGAPGIVYTQDTASRLQTITQGGRVATFGYKPWQGGLQSVTITESAATRLVATRTIDNLGRIAAIDFDNNPAAAGLLASRTYTYNAANQRILVEQDNQRGATQPEATQRWAYGYDVLGQVTSAQKQLYAGAALPGYVFGYSYDDIGNRKSTQTNGRTATYTSDALNRYTSRTTPLAVDVRGVANTSVTVAVNDEPTIRTGADFYREVAVSSGLKEQAIKVQAVEVSATEKMVTENRTALVPAAPESFTYDADGNLSQDGLWTYEWDGENRLTSQTMRADIVGVTTRYRLECAYDGESRRIQKIVKTWNTGTSAWVVVSDTRYLYDGWNLMAEYDALASFALVRSHVWGLDLSASRQGAGGVGGLLWTDVASTAKAYASAADANGNVVAYVDLSNGTVAGRRDYGAFGEPVVVNGVAGDLPFGFSTKYTDKETGYVYYGYRYYSPGTGRWLSRDPIGEKGGVNLYGMVRNNPITRVDKLGLTEVAAGVGASASIVLAPGFHGTIEISKTFHFITGWPPITKICMNASLSVGVTGGVFIGAGVEIPLGYSGNDSLEGPAVSTAVVGGAAVEGGGSIGVAKSDTAPNITAAGSGASMGPGIGGYAGVVKVFSGTSCYSSFCGMLPGVSQYQDLKHMRIAIQQARDAFRSWLMSP